LILHESDKQSQPLVAFAMIVKAIIK